MRLHCSHFILQYELRTVRLCATISRGDTCSFACFFLIFFFMSPWIFLHCSFDGHPAPGSPGVSELVLGTFKAAEIFLCLCQDSYLQTTTLTLCWVCALSFSHVNCVTLYRHVCAFTNSVQSTVLPHVNSDGGVKTSSRWLVDYKCA